MRATPTNTPRAGGGKWSTANRHCGAQGLRWHSSAITDFSSLSQLPLLPGLYFRPSTGLSATSRPSATNLLQAPSSATSLNSAGGLKPQFSYPGVVEPIAAGMLTSSLAAWKLLVLRWLPKLAFRTTDSFLFGLCNASVAKRLHKMKKFSMFYWDVSC